VTDESAMIVIWSAIALLATVAVLVALVVSSRGSRSTEGTRPDLPRRAPSDLGATHPQLASDVPEIEMVDRHAERSGLPRHYSGARLVTWSVNRCAGEEEVNDEKSG
jgi:hypothetical protein